MLLLGSKLIGTPIVSLQTGMPLAVTKTPIINPGNLMILAYEVEGPMLAERPSFIRIADVRELSSIGMIIDSNDEFVGVEDIIALKKLYELNFKLIGLNVVDEANHKLGKVIDFNLDTDDFVIQRLSVKPGVIKSLSETELLIHRSQIIEINDRSIIVQAAAKKLQQIEKPVNLTYLNPFRTNSPQTENAEA